MKILICTGIYPPDIGGPATYTKLISEELKKREHKVSVLTYGFQNVKCQMSNVKYISKKHPLPLRYFLYFLKVLQLGKNVDVIYVQDPVSSGLPTALANLFLCKKMILKVVGDYAWEQASQISNFRFQMSNLDSFYPFKKENYPLKIRLMKKIQLWVAKKADKIVTPSFYLRDVLIRGWGVDKDKIRVIYNGFDGVNVNLSQAIKNYGTPFKIISVGRLVPWKGFDSLIEIIKDIPGVELEIVGDGPEKDSLRLTAYGLQLGDRVKLSGKLSHDEVIKRMQEADLFILNSSYEGLSHVILEAMACGLPVAVSCAGGNAELVGESEDRGYLFDYNSKEQIKEKINYIILHSEETEEKAKKAREYVAGLSKEKMIERLEKELKEV